MSGLVITACIAVALTTALGYGLRSWNPSSRPDRTPPGATLRRATGDDRDFFDDYTARREDTP